MPHHKVMTREEQIRFVKSRIKHKSTKKEHIQQLKLILTTLENNQVLSVRESMLIYRLKDIEVERNRRYKANARAKKAGAANASG